jgi:hypothetical protein
LVDGVLSAVQRWQDDVEAVLSAEPMAEFMETCEMDYEGEVTWDGTAGLNGLVELESEGIPAVRDRFNEKCDDVAAFLSDSEDEPDESRPAREEVETAAPLVAMFNQVDDLASSDDGDDEFDQPVTALASYYIGICLLEAIEDAFENEDIRSRLTDTTIEADPDVRPSGRLAFLPF